jgi:hypothetical protein
MPSAGYSGTHLVKKLGIKAGQKIAFLNQSQGYQKSLEPLPTDLSISDTLGKDLDFIHFFVKEMVHLEKNLPELKNALTYNGTLWISWPKKASKVETDLDGNAVRELGLAIGLVDVKVAAIDEIWSGLKFVYRQEDRPAS